MEMSKQEAINYLSTYLSTYLWPYSLLTTSNTNFIRLINSGDDCAPYYSLSLGVHCTGSMQGLEPTHLKYLARHCSAGYMGPERAFSHSHNERHLWAS